MSHTPVRLAANDPCGHLAEANERWMPPEGLITVPSGISSSRCRIQS